jgi:hypothetical protein
MALAREQEACIKAAQEIDGALARHRRLNEGHHSDGGGMLRSLYDRSFHKVGEAN